MHAAISMPSAAQSVRRPPRASSAHSRPPSEATSAAYPALASAAATSTVARSAPPVSSDGHELQNGWPRGQRFHYGALESRVPHMERLKREDGETIAYLARGGKPPGLLWLGGFKSDMTGTKAHGAGRMGRARGPRASALRLFRPRPILRRFPQGHDLALEGRCAGGAGPAHHRPASADRLQHGRLDRACLRHSPGPSALQGFCCSRRRPISPRT